MLRTLETYDRAALAGARVLVRVGFNVPIENGDSKEKFRIVAAKETVDFLCAAGARVALLSHLGRPNGLRDAAYSLAQLTDDAALLLDRPVVFAHDCVGTIVAETLERCADGTVVLLENVRFHAEEESSDPAVRRDFATMLAAPFDLFVNDDFSVCHRDQASVTDIARIMPSVAGLRVAKEVAVLTQLQHVPEHPAVAVIGGAKIETKLPMIRAIEKTYDTICVGGKIANEALDEHILFDAHVLLPEDFVGDRCDIGPETISRFVSVICDAKTVLWNGPVGWYEKPEYAGGTEAIVRALAQTQAFTVIGGGESIEAAERYGILHAIDFVSTGGGSLLEFLSGVILPGIQVLQDEDEEVGEDAL